MDNIKISVVTVCYNAAASIEKTILSVINQTYPNVEYIIIDGASTDGTIDIINKYREQISCFLSEPDNGIYDAMNKGINVATGEWINFMNSGDMFVDSLVLDRIFESEYNGYDVVFGDHVSRINNRYYQRECRPFYEHLPLHQSMGFVHQSAFVRLSKAKRNPFDLRYKLAADYNMMITLYKKGCKFAYIHMPVALYEGNGISDQRMKQHIMELFEIDFPKRKINIVFVLKKYLGNAIKMFMKPKLFVIFPKLMEEYSKSKMGLHEIIIEK